MQTGARMQNRRQYLRTASDAIVDMSHPSFGTITVRAGDLSDGGMSVDMGSHFPPPEGTIVSVIIKRHTGTINAEPIQMKVIHVNPKEKTVGLMFL